MPTMHVRIHLEKGVESAESIDSPHDPLPGGDFLGQWLDIMVCLYGGGHLSGLERIGV